MKGELPKAFVKPPSLVKHASPLRPLREGRGFSLGELKAVGLRVYEARKLGLYVDLRRKSSVEENIEMLKEFLRKKLPRI